MEIHYFKTLPSTQLYLQEAIKTKTLTAPCIVVSEVQTNGIGSRGNSWQGSKGNLFFSFAIPKTMLPDDLPLAASSIYFSMLLKEVLNEHNDQIWIKWPNDFYLGSDKIGGTITTIVQECLIGGIGVNLGTAPSGFRALDVDSSAIEIVKAFEKKLNAFPTWKKVLNLFKIEFTKSKAFFTHDGNTKVAMRNATLCDDGALLVEGQRIFSLR